MESRVKSPTESRQKNLNW